MIFRLAFGVRRSAFGVGRPTEPVEHSLQLSFVMLLFSNE